MRFLLLPAHTCGPSTSQTGALAAAARAARSGVSRARSLVRGFFRARCSSRSGFAAAGAARLGGLVRLSRGLEHLRRTHTYRVGGGGGQEEGIIILLGWLRLLSEENLYILQKTFSTSC